MPKVLTQLLFGGRGAATWLGEGGLLILRVWTGLVLAFAHGWDKLPVSGQFINVVAARGFPLPTVSAWLAALGEFLGGILLALGLLTRFAALWVILVMAGAAFVAHANDPWFGAPPSRQAALMFLVPALCLLLTGSGRTGLDQFIRKR